MSLLVYIACNDVPTFVSTRLLFGNQRQSIGMRLSTHSNFRPFQSSVRLRSRGSSPYTAALHNHQQPAPLRIFPRLCTLGLAFCSSSLAFRPKGDTLPCAVGSFRVPLRSVTYSFEQHCISCIYGVHALARDSADPACVIFRRNVSHNGTRPYSSGWPFRPSGSS